MNKKDHTFAEQFRQCCGRSCAYLAYEMNQTDSEYEAAMKECSDLYEEIEAKLGEDYKLINRFDTAKNNILSRDDPYIYQQGFQDCIYLLRWMGAL